MAQFEVYKFLKKNKGKVFTPKQISDKLSISSNTASVACMKLAKYSFITKIDESYKKCDVAYVYKSSNS